MKKPNKNHLIYCGLFLFLFSLNSCHEEKKEENQEGRCLTEKEIEEMEPLEVINSEVEKELRLNGQVSHTPKAMIHYTGLVNGVITETHFEMGDKVEKNEVLAEIKSTELNAMQSEVEQTKEKLKVAERELEKTQSFYDDGIASEKGLTEAKSERNNLQSKLNKLQENLRFYSASDQKNVFEIKAPKSGYVVNNKLVDGMKINDDGKTLFTISNLKKVWINLSVYATDMHFMKEGMDVKIKTNSYPDSTFTAKVSHISQVLDPDKNTLNARVVYDNVKLLLKPGLQVEVLATSHNSKKAPRIPTDAVVFHNDEYYVDVIGECHTNNRHIKILSQDEHTVYVESGLEPGEKIVTKNALRQFEERLENE